MIPWSISHQDRQDLIKNSIIVYLISLWMEEMAQ